MSRSAAKVIGITLGDPAGIGPEVTAKALRRRKRSSKEKFVIIGDDLSFKKYFAGLKNQLEFLPVRIETRQNYKLGCPNAQSAELSFRFLAKSVELLKNKSIHAVVTAPLSKEYVSASDSAFVGHTEYYAQMFGVQKFDMMFVTKQIKSVIVTRHVPIQKVFQLLTQKKVYESIALAHKSLKEQFGIRRPSIAVCGLNPHAGEGGKIGQEEVKSIIPAIKAAQKLGIKVQGPFAADTMFIPRRCKDFDVIISMFHDQGLIAMKTLYFDSVVNLTIGLPFVRTSPAHGTAYDIAGKNKADASSMFHAIDLAAQLS